jgi:hypothetical protein
MAPLRSAPAAPLRRRRSLSRAGAVCAIGVLALAGVLHGQAPTSGHFDEYRVKAAVLFNFAKFVEWPASAFASPTSPLVLCVIGADPYGAALDDTVSGRLVGGRTVAIVRTPEPQRGCHIAFISNSERRRLPAVLGRLREGAVLTVGEVAEFVDVGGMVVLGTRGDQVTFDIDREMAERAGLRVSARLLSLAVSAKRPARSPR